MTFEEFNRELDQKAKKLKNTEVLRRVATGVHSEMIVRIFERGENTSGVKIGSYDSENELWVYPSDLPRKVSPKGKPGSGRDAKKTVYFRSYKDLRSKQGRESGFVNLRLTNDLQSDMANTGVSASSNDVADAKPIKVSDTVYEVRLRRRENIEKRKGLELKRNYGTIFSPSKKEIELFKKSMEKELRLIYAQ